MDALDSWAVNPLIVAFPSAIFVCNIYWYWFKRGAEERLRPVIPLAGALGIAMIVLLTLDGSRVGHRIFLDIAAIGLDVIALRAVRKLRPA